MRVMVADPTSLPPTADLLGAAWKALIGIGGGAFLLRMLSRAFRVRTKEDFDELGKVLDERRFMSAEQAERVRILRDELSLAKAEASGYREAIDKYHKEFLAKIEELDARHQKKLNELDGRYQTLFSDYHTLRASHGELTVAFITCKDRLNAVEQKMDVKKYTNPGNDFDGDSGE